jgi:Predicted alternative thymidylate synthase
MKVTQVALRPTEASNAAGRPALTPELLAASGARYSRNNEGLEAILARIDPANLDKSVDSIFRMIDYGHASIADMAPVALFVDGVSLYLAYYLWTLAPTAGGQESSTRYIKLDASGLVAPEVLGIPVEEQADWRQAMDAAFGAYRAAVAFWESIAKADPDVARIPRSLSDDPSEKAKRAVARMRRNYAFDRARYFLPVAAATNVMMVQSARAWVTVCQHLLSHPLPEARALGECVAAELALATPRLLKHATTKPSFEQGIRREWDAARALCGRLPLAEGEHAPAAFLDVIAPPGGGLTDAQAAADLELHDNRYAYFGETLRRTAVCFGWEAVAFAEIRDLNRHRTGTKYCPPVPVGFYHATDAVPAGHPGAGEYAALGAVGTAANRAARARLEAGRPDAVYHLLLGAQLPFEHTTTADKFLYEAELRTGTGAHYRYARHLRDALALWYDRYPATRGLVQEGSAEPE